MNRASCGLFCKDIVALEVAAARRAVMNLMHSFPTREFAG